MFSIGDIVDLAIQIERNGENICRGVLTNDIDPALASLLEWMANQEAQHIVWFAELKHTARITLMDSRLEEMGKTLLHDVLGDQSFSLNDADFSKIDHVAKLLSLLIDFERDTVLFYEMIASVVVDSETLSYLDIIIEEERQHISKIQNYLINPFANADQQQ